MENTTTVQKMTPKFFFISLGVLVSLITVVSSFLSLAFDTLDKKFPDALNATYQYGYYSYNYDSIRSAIATLIIFFPILLALSYVWNKTIKNGLGSVDEKLRKWMMYLVLFLSSLVVVIDLVTLVRYFVAGEITSRFILKAVIALVAGLYVGVYHMFLLLDKKTLWGFNMARWTAIKSSILVVALISFSFYVIGSPTTQRNLRLDQQRLTDLQTIQSQVITYWQQKQKLPVTLKDMVDPTSYVTLPVDPEMRAYEYKATGDLSFELCATFSQDIPAGWQEGGTSGVIPMAYPVATDSSYPVRGGVNESWDHKAGRTCYERTIDKDIYQPFNKEPVIKQ